LNLTVRNLCKTYNNGIRALDNVCFETGEGMFGLLGPNGAGKSTLMRTIATLQRPDSGSIAFDDINVLKDEMSLRKILGYLPQEFGVYPKTSASDLLEYLALLKGISSAKDRESVIMYALELTNLYEVRNEYVEGFSGGMKRRFGIAQLLLNDPKLIIVDEPTAGLDPAERNRFLNILREIASSNIIIFSTHIVDDIKDLCNDMAVLNKGRILRQYSPSQAVKELEGKIWTKDIQGIDISDAEKTFEVISSKFNADNSIKIRVFAEAKPSEEFEPAVPSLEDAYFTALSRNETVIE
jgi:ABC-type multidrug transport system ATPase subunit